MSTHARVRNAFSLVELLVMLCVVSVLAALLLPTLEQSIEQSRRIVCMSGTRQMFLATQNYAQDSKGFYPGPSKLEWSGNISVLEYYADISVPSSAGGFSTGLYGLIVVTGYLDRSLLRCPSMDFERPLVSGGNYNVTHYGYLYNTMNCSIRTADRYTRQSFYSSGMLRQPLFADACSYRCSGAYPYEPYGSSGANWQFNLKWAHCDGGNIVDHAGAGRFVQNYRNPIAPVFSWPAAAGADMTRPEIMAHFNTH